VPRMLRVTATHIRLVADHEQDVVGAGRGHQDRHTGGRAASQLQPERTTSAPGSTRIGPRVLEQMWPGPLTQARPSMDSGAHLRVPRDDRADGPIGRRLVEVPLRRGTAPACADNTTCRRQHPNTPHGGGAPWPLRRRPSPAAALAQRGKSSGTTKPQAGQPTATRTATQYGGEGARPAQRCLNRQRSSETLARSSIRTWKLCGQCASARPVGASANVVRRESSRADGPTRRMNKRDRSSAHTTSAAASRVKQIAARSNAPWHAAHRIRTSWHAATATSAGVSR
jgi:hypothetical protein